MQYKLSHNLSDIEVENVFQEHLEDQGFVFDASHPHAKLDGKTHYLKTNNHGNSKNRKKKNGWYKAYLNPHSLPAGRYGWLNGDSPTFGWSLYNHLQNTQQNSKLIKVSDSEAQERQRASALQREAAEKEAQAVARLLMILTRIEYLRSQPITQHAYLEKKNITLDEAKQTVRLLNALAYTKDELHHLLPNIALTEHEQVNIDDLVEQLMLAQKERLLYRFNRLFIVGFDLDWNMTNFQLITAKKDNEGRDKWFIRGSVKLGTFHPCNFKTLAELQEVIICEGWATGIAIRKMVGSMVPIMVAWDKANIVYLAQCIRRRYWQCNIFLAIDNDYNTKTIMNENGERISIHRNAGAQAGIKAAHSVGATLICPPFDHNAEEQQELSDWDDYMKFYGPDQSSLMFNTLLEAGIKTMAKSETIMPLVDLNQVNLLACDQDISDSLFLGFLAYIQLLNYGFLSPEITQELRIDTYSKMFKSISNNYNLKTTFNQNRQQTTLLQKYAEAALQLLLNESDMDRHEQLAESLTKKIVALSKDK